MRQLVVMCTSRRKDVLRSLASMYLCPEAMSNREKWLLKVGLDLKDGEAPGLSDPVSSSALGVETQNV
jgi:hypothetical protein